MEDVLDTWPGTLIVVSHDRYLIERVTDQQYAVVGGRLRHLPGGVDEYLRAEGRRVGASCRTPRRPASGLSGAERRDLEKQVASLDRRMRRLAQETRADHDALADARPGRLRGPRGDRGPHPRPRGRARRPRARVARGRGAPRDRLTRPTAGRLRGPVDASTAVRRTARYRRSGCRSRLRRTCSHPDRPLENPPVRRRSSGTLGHPDARRPRCPPPQQHPQKPTEETHRAEAGDRPEAAAPLHRRRHPRHRRLRADRPGRGRGRRRRVAAVPHRLRGRDDHRVLLPGAR